jgi:collagenase-like PrtC family protease
MKLSLGYIPFLWRAESLRQFYQEMAGQPVDVIYLGEAVCSKRRALRTAEWIDLARDLSACGKQVVLSTLALIEARSELATLKRLCENGVFMVEANDMAAVQMMAERNLPFVAGNGINIYNTQTLRILHEAGMKRWVFPVELSAATLEDILGEARQTGLCTDLETEVLAYGHLPLAYSARCFTARARQLPKDNCAFVCGDYPVGLPLKTQESQEIFTINGVQTLSGSILDLSPEIPRMRRMGVNLLRISPDGPQMAEVITRFRGAIDGESSKLAGIANSINGYWHGQAGMSHSDSG